MARMVPLKLYRDNSLGFPDLLNWGAVVADGVVLNKDGSLLARCFYRGKDLATVSAAERNQVSSVFSGALSKLGSGWMLHQDALRKLARDYPGATENAFPEAVSALIEAERRAQFQAEGAHYESFYGLAVSFLPPLVGAQKAVQPVFRRSRRSTIRRDRQPIAAGVSDGAAGARRPLVRRPAPGTHAGRPTRMRRAGSTSRTISCAI